MSKLPPDKVIDLVDTTTSVVQDEKYKNRLTFPFIYDHKQVTTYYFRYIEESIVLNWELTPQEQILKIKDYVSISDHDIKKLNDEEELNDVIINFWMHWLIMNTKE